MGRCARGAASSSRVQGNKSICGDPAENKIKLKEFRKTKYVAQFLKRNVNDKHCVGVCQAKSDQI